MISPPLAAVKSWAVIDCGGTSNVTGPGASDYVNSGAGVKVPTHAEAEEIELQIKHHEA